LRHLLGDVRAFKVETRCETTGYACEEVSLVAEVAKKQVDVVRRITDAGQHVGGYFNDDGYVGDGEKGSEPAQSLEIEPFNVNFDQCGAFQMRDDLSAGSHRDLKPLSIASYESRRACVIAVYGQSGFAGDIADRDIMKVDALAQAI
jgi:hypothetical protein